MDRNQPYKLTSNRYHSLGLHAERN